jgi:hypothetical protein
MIHIKMPKVCYSLDCFACTMGGTCGSALYHRQWSDAVITVVIAVVLNITSTLINRKYESRQSKINGRGSNANG